MKNPKVIEETSDSTSLHMVVKHDDGYGVIIEFQNGSRTELLANSFEEARQMAIDLVAK